MLDRAYLDHASTSPLRPAAREALVACLDATGDPGRIHAEGLAARVALEQARAQVAGLLGARPREVVFTSGATEAIAAACWGAAARGGHQVVPAVEHSAVRLAAARHGDVTVVPVGGTGRVDVDDLLGAVEDGRTGLVHLQWGNHEVGTLQPVDEAVAACRARGVLVHVDAAQAVGRVPVAFRALGPDLLSVSAHKLGGPPGVGALLVRQGLRLPPLLVGGDQERARRAGLENVPALAGFGAACAALSAGGGVEAEGAEQRRLTGRILAALDGVPGLAGLRVYGDPA
ncbi:MAG TPA: aminotransferase class V-fold PLP-dependent enzyme, partial [Acidimicrobiales bacterium]|nr:aminotransferase class V-fold PLP-dependent enzyme [Acidimicrobiales bacterium]